MLSLSMSGNGFSKIMFWLDGLIPSYRHFVIDLVSLLAVACSVNGSNTLLNTREDETLAVSWSLSGSGVFEQFFILVVLNCVLRGADWDVRNRWPITFPLVSILLLEVVQLCLQLIVRQLFHEDDAVLWWLSVGTRVMENFVVATSVLLCGLFPVVKLPDPKGPHSVGIIEQMQLPVNWAIAADKLKATQPKRIETETSKVIGDPSYLNDQESVNIRIFYPTNIEFSHTSFKKCCQYIPKSFSSKFCDHVMKSAAPYPLNKFGFLLYNWKLVQIPAIPNAPLLTKENEGTSETFPLVVYSHGLFGSPHLYTKQALDLASSGYIVMMIHHKDGSSPYVPLEGEEQRRYDEYKHWLDGFVREHFQKHKDYTEVVRFRRRQTIFRATEVLSATDALLEAQSLKFNISSSDAHQALSRLFDSTSKIDQRRIIFMGHSFGGATVTTATATALFHASRADDESSSKTWHPCALIAHEPANDWSSDFARYTLYNNSILEKGRTICKDANASAGEENDKTSAEDKYSGGTGGYDCGNDKALEETLTKKGSAVKTIHNIPTLVLFSNEWASKGWGGSSLMKQMATAHDNHTDEYPSPFIVKVIPYSSHQEFSDTCSFIPLWLGRLTKQIPSRAESGGKTPIDQLSDIWQQMYNHFLDSIVKTEKVE